MVSESRPGRFAAIEPDVPHRHHDAIEFPDGRNVLVTQLSEGQRVTVLQLLYRHDYSKDELMGWANRMKASGANRAGIYFNNDYDAHAPKNATVLRRILKGFGDRSAIPKQGRPSGHRSPLGIGEKPMKTNGGRHGQ